MSAASTIISRFSRKAAREQMVNCRNSSRASVGLPVASRKIAVEFFLVELELRALLL